MKKIIVLKTLITAGALSLTLSAIAAEPNAAMQTPAIAGYGAIHAIGERDPHFTISPHEKSKLVFEITDLGSPQHVNAALDKVARTINLYVADGVPLDRIDCVVTLGRSAAAIALNDQHYREKFATYNPNLDLLNKLHAAGVRIVVSGQGLADQNWNKNDISPDATVALSSVTAIAALMQNGYTVEPL